MKYKVKIRNNETKEIRICDQRSLDWDRNNDEGQLFWWTEGNFGCDCNRGAEFERAKDMSYDIINSSCGHNKYSVIEAIFENGDVLEIDGEEILE